MDHSAASSIVCYSTTGRELLGSFYDNYQHRIVGHSNLRVPIRSTTSTRPARFHAFFGDSARAIHPFHNIDNQQSLPSYEDLVERISFVAYKLDSRPIDAYTRLLYYSWIDREEFYPDNVVHSISIDSLGYITKAATHLLIRLAYGIDVIIILRLSPHHNIEHIDDELKRSQALFQANGSFPELALLEKYSTEQKIQLAISSTPPSLRSFQNLSELRNYIHKLKSNGNIFWPIVSTISSLDDIRRRMEQSHTEQQPLAVKHLEKMKEILSSMQSIPTDLEQCRTAEIRKHQNWVRPESLYQIATEHYRKEADCQRHRDYLTRRINYYLARQPMPKVFQEETTDIDRLQRWVDDCRRFIEKILGPPPAQIKKIYILLLGQTGVGKSTFINALANYLTFDTLKQAEDGTPQVIIPVSFIITSGFYFDEQNITFGPKDPTRNENFNDRGHSVTQQCRSYTFDLPQSNTQICIIDTPGFGDTRGIDQDQVNIKHITDYLSQHPQLDAICCLFRPNESKMNILFRTCFMQLFSVIDRNAYDKVMFCFTNSRSTFYAPGNTGPLVRKMLETLAGERGVELKMEKKNTFCFDNEAFRYLVARLNGVEFKVDEQEEYANSWKVSVKTAKQLLEYVRQRSTQTT